MAEIRVEEANLVKSREELEALLEELISAPGARVVWLKPLRDVEKKKRGAKGNER